MKKQLLFLFFIIASLSVFSQKEANLWYFGRNAGLDFNTTPPTALTNGQLNTDEGCSSFSDANGNLLFYSDGIRVYNKNHQLMNYSNGNPANNLQGNPSSTQSGMIIPKPGSTNIYYLFTVGTDFVPNGVAPNPGFNYYTVDMHLNGGLGEISDGPLNLAIDPITRNDLSNSWSEKVAAVKGKDCNTFWVLSFIQDTFFAYKVDENGVDIANPVLSRVFFNAFDKRGYLQVSPDGSKIAFADFNALGNGSINGSLQLFDFNNETGEVNPNSQLELISNFSNLAPYGVAFSQQSNKLYTATYDGSFSIFQFDLNSVNIPNSRTQIINKSGFRGGLQLGPDGKIYASIPGNFSLDVIENPNDDASNIIYTQNAINLNGRITAQGLPPFIASLLLPIEIKDQINSEVVNNQTLQNCIGESLTIAPDPVTGNNINYEWFFDNGATVVSVSNTINLTLNTLSLSDVGTYNLKVTLTDDCGNNVEQEAQFNLEVYQPTTATQPNDVFFCDIDNDGFNTFDLAADVTPQVLNGQDPTVFEVIYYLSQTDADNNNTANAITNPYTNPTAFSNQTIFARMHNIVAPDACFDVKSFTLAVTGQPNATQPVPYQECDDITSGSDTDGIFNSFLLNTKDTEILGAIDPTIYTVSYHTSLSGAQTDNSTDVIDKNNPYTNTVANSQTVYVRVENRNNPACNDTSKTLELVVNPLPIINNIVELKQCDNDTDAFANFNLNEAASDISADFMNETFVFFETLADAQNNTAPIANPTVYRNATVTSDTVWARAITNNGCYRISQVNLTVSTTGIPATFQRSFTQCDDFLDIDGNNNVNNDDTDGVTSFDFSSIDAEIRALFTAVGQQINVTYYRNEADAAAEINPITDTSNYRNIGYPNTQQIYVRVDSDLDNDCLGFGAHITLNVNPVPMTNKPMEDINECDDFDSGSFTDGINNNINLTVKAAEILGTQNPADYSLTYHTTPEDANTGNNAIANPNNFTNTIRDTQPIYVRVVNNNTGCWNDHVTFNININPLPVITQAIPNLEICDDGNDGSAVNGLAQNINLSVRDEAALEGRDETIFEVSYHRTRQDAIDGINALPKTAYDNNPNFSVAPPANSPIDTPHTERLWVSLLNTNTQCRYGLASLDILTYPEPTIPANINNYTDCDNDSDTMQDDANGINGDITLSSKTEEILVNYPTAEHVNYKITYHESLADAQTGDNPIDDSKYQNTTNNQEIFVRVQNTQTMCVNDDLSFRIVINSLPDFTVDTPVILCKDEQITLAALNANENYTYKWFKFGDPNTVLSSSSTYDANQEGDYYVIATTTNGNNCQRRLDIRVNLSSRPTLTEEHIIIEDDTNNNRLNNYSIKINTQISLGEGNYQFKIIDEEGNEIGFQDEPIFENIPGGIYTVVVQDKNGCQPDATLDVSVIEYPKFITPNGDGINDTWAIKGANSSFYPSSSIHIFDRYGKIVSIIPIDSIGWNGTYNGNPLPSSDYWFKIQLVDRNGKIHQHQGHFSLLRR